MKRKFRGMVRNYTKVARMGGREKGLPLGAAGVVGKSLRCIADSSLLAV